MNRPEQALQRAVAQYLAYQIPAHMGWWTAIGHGGGGEMRGKILKGQGVKAGVPDIMLGREGRVYFIELKAKLGRVLNAQDDFHDLLAQHKTPCRVCRSVDDVMAAIHDWGFLDDLSAPTIHTMKQRRRV